MSCFDRDGKGLAREQLAKVAHVIPCARQVCDAFQSYIWEPVLVKESALNAATEAACLILSIDETVKNPQLVDLQRRRL